MPNIESAKATDKIRLRFARSHTPVHDTASDYLGSGTLIYPKYLIRARCQANPPSPIGSGPSNSKNGLRVTLSW
jgi:hypothetical protein